MKRAKAIAQHSQELTALVGGALLLVVVVLITSITGAAVPV